MGLDASVSCNCFQEGRTEPPPFPREWLAFDGEGRLELLDEHDVGNRWYRVHQWKQDCCEHEDLDFACEHVANWSGYRLFQAALGELGWDRFPFLKEQLPNANGGQTPAVASAECLKELTAFREAGEIGRVTTLVDTASGAGLHEHVAAYDGVFLHAGRHGVRVGLGESDLFVVNARTEDVLFRARRLRQVGPSGADITGDVEGLTWENLDTGVTWCSNMALAGRCIPWDDGRWQNDDGRVRFEYPSDFHVEERPRLASDFEAIVTALQVLFAASVETGNPVRWS
ncbi:MAG: hypothetical protein AAF533_16275 [Acidobacteriota bacterium]